MDSKRLIELPSDLMERCKHYGQRRVWLYRRGFNAASLAVSSHGAENNPELQAIALMSECAFALWASLDPIGAVNWSDRCDAGFDVKAWGARWDVKYTGRNGRYLIWPIRKRHILASKQFDDLVLIKAAPPRFLIVGWILKAIFVADHHTAPLGHALDEGTWYLDQSELWGYQSNDPTADARRAIRDGRQADYVMGAII